MHESGRLLALTLAMVALCVGVGLLAPAARADGTLAAPTSAVIGGAPGVVFVQFDGIFSGRTSTGAYRVPYRITIPAPPARTNRTVVVELPQFAHGLGALEQLLGLRFLLSRGFAHAGIGWSTASFGAGLDLRILDPGADRVFIDGGVTDGNGRTDDEIVVDFARALTSDGNARAMLGRVDRRYLTGVSDSSDPVLRLVASGRAQGVFDFVLPVVAEAHESRSALAAGRYLGKVIVVGSEAEIAATDLVQRGAASDRSRSYAVAGTPEVPDFLGFPSLTTMSTPASFEPELRAHFLHGHRWVADGKQPPPSTRLKTSSDGTLARDRHGNAISVTSRGRPVARLPFVELGEARFTTGLVGRYDHVKTVTELGFGDHAAYLRAFSRALDNYRRAGSIGKADAEAMRRRAALCPPLTFTQTYRDHYHRFADLRPCPARERRFSTQGATP